MTLASTLISPESHPRVGIWSGLHAKSQRVVFYTVNHLGFVISASMDSASILPRRPIPVEDLEAQLSPSSIKREV